jgi:hypothetical protein
MELQTIAKKREDKVVLALVPYRKGRPLVSDLPKKKNTSSLISSSGTQGSNDDGTTDTRTIHPWFEIPASDTDNDSTSTSTSTTIGRIELLQTLWTACGCHRRQSHDTYDVNKNDADNSMQDINRFYYLKGRGCTTNKCFDCRAVTDWGKRYLPRGAWILMKRKKLNVNQQRRAGQRQQPMAVSRTRASATNGVGGDDGDDDNTTTAFQVSIEFKASKYPVQTLVRIHRYHSEQQQQQQHQPQPEQPSAEEFPRPPEQPGACSTTVDRAAFVPVRQVTLAVGDVISFHPPVVTTGVGASLSASWAPLELQLVRCSVEESHDKDDQRVDEEEQ